MRCAGLADGAEVAVVNIGGIQVGKAVATDGAAVVSLAGHPKAPYMAVMKSNGQVRSHRFIKW